jgi:hypothetical protein
MLGKQLSMEAFILFLQILCHVNDDVKQQQKDSSIHGGHIINHANFPLQNTRKF